MIRKKIWCLILVSFFNSVQSGFGLNVGSDGMVKGNVTDAETRAPLMGVNVILLNSALGAVTDAEGSFAIEKIPAGAYSIRFRYLGYEPYTETDVIVRPGRTTVSEIRLQTAAIRSGEVKVNAGYFRRNDGQPLSTTAFSREEIRRAPGSAGDVSRILMALPSIAKVNDQSNNLIVRGGSPIENAFFIDNIEILNINHFPTQGASGGPIGMVNVDFIQDVRFSSGGFSAAYGDRLSSIMEIAFREGNRSRFDGQLDLNVAGFGGVAEGPLFRSKGSWLFSVRRSYLDLLVKAIDIGTAVAPSYGDCQWKAVYDIHPKHQLTLLGLWGDDHNHPDRSTAQANDMVYYGNQDINQSTTGLNWRALWGKRGYSNTSIALTSNRFREDFYETNSGFQLIRNHSEDRSINIRQVNHFRLRPELSVEFGLEAKRLTTNYDNAFGAFTDATGDSVAPLGVNDRVRAYKYGIFLNCIVRPSDRLTATLGVRTDFFSFHQKRTAAPRLSFSYRLNALTSVTGSAGMYYQNLPLVMLSQNPANRNLQDPMSVHCILGLDRMLTETTKLTLEAYQKEYRSFPMDPGEPGLFLIDELYYRYGFFFSHARMVDKGRAVSRGFELTLQKKLAKDFYGLVGASVFRARYQGLDGLWRDRVFDNRMVFSIEGGYKPNARWEFSLRWIYAGGTPFTPFDLEKSEVLNREILDGRLINRSRYPDYHSMNIRFDRRFLFQRSNLVFYFSMWNVYNRKNVASYFWNGEKKQLGVIYQWGLLPLFGLEWEL